MEYAKIASIAVAVGLLVTVYQLWRDRNDLPLPDQASVEREQRHEEFSLRGSRTVRIVGPPFYPNESDKFDRIFRNRHLASEFEQVVAQTIAAAWARIAGLASRHDEPQFALSPKELEGGSPDVQIKRDVFERHRPLGES